MTLAVLAALGAMPGPDDPIDPFRRHLRSTDPRERGRALWRMEQLGTEARGLAPDVAKCLADPDRVVRIEAAHLLGRLGDRQTVGPLVDAALQHEDWQLTAVAALSLAQLAPGHARPVLARVAEEHWYPPTREAARLALATPGGAAPEADLRRLLAPHLVCPHPPVPGPRSPALRQSEHPGVVRGLAYSVKEQVLGERGWRAISRLRVPDLALQARGGWWLGSDRGEFGGEVAFRSRSGATLVAPLAAVGPANAQELWPLGDGSVLAVTGLAHLGLSRGAVARLESVGGEPRVLWWRALPAAPDASWLDEGRLFVDTAGGSVVVSPDGDIRLAPCHASGFRRRLADRGMCCRSAGTAGI